MFTAALLSVLLTTPAVSNPLEPALAGQVLCLVPDEDQKTCAEIDTWRPAPNGTYENMSQSNFAADETTLSYVMTNPVVVKGDAICGTLRSKDVQTLKLKSAGKPLPAPVMALILRRLKESLVEYLNKELCSFFEDTPEGLVIRGKVNGIPDEGLTAFAKWVSPSDGYHLVK